MSGKKAEWKLHSPRLPSHAYAVGRFVDSITLRRDVDADCSATRVFTDLIRGRSRRAEIPRMKKNIGERSGITGVLTDCRIVRLTNRRFSNIEFGRGSYLRYRYSARSYR